MSERVALLAGSWGVLMAVAPLLQVRAILRRGHSDGVSAGHIAVLWVGFALWLAYGVTIASAPLVVTNVVALTTGSITLAVIVRYRPGTESRAVAGQGDS